MHLTNRVFPRENIILHIDSTMTTRIRIGVYCLIAAVAVVVRNVADGQDVAGVPARPMKPRERA